MKRISSLLCTLLLSLSVVVFSQETVTEENTVQSETVKQEGNKKQEGQLPIKPFTWRDYSHWSLTLDGGLNHPMMDMPYDGLFYDIAKQWSLGGMAEYTINPAFSFGLQYMYSITSYGDKRGNFDSKIHHITPFIGFNFLNYVLYDRNRKWDFWITAGVGAAHFNSELNYAWKPGSYSYQGQIITTEDEWNDTEGVGFQKHKDWVGIIPITFEVSYNITKQIAIALKYRQVMYMDDNIEGGTRLDNDHDKYGRKNYSYAGSSNDQLGNLLLSLRWDITGKDATHMRKVSWVEYKPKDAKDGQAKDPRVDSLANRVKDLEDRVDNLPIPVVVSPNECNCVPEPVSIYFDFDKYDFTTRSLIIISQVAQKMKEDTSLKVEIRGYTDIDGTDKYNEILSKRRAQATKDELVNMYGISADRIDANGEGKLKFGDRKYHAVNRRCDFIWK